MAGEHSEIRKGALYAVGAYTVWGFSPVYFKLVAAVPSSAVVAHRVIWSFALMLLIVSARRQWARFALFLRQWRTLPPLAGTAALLALNWLVFIWAVNHDYLMDASLGYYINPLLNVVLGMLFLGERLRRAQWLAVSLAVAGVAIQVIAFGSVPWIALVLAGSFGCYGLVRKRLRLDVSTAFLMETLLLLPAAIIYLSLPAETSANRLLHNTASLNLLLICAGPLTAVPLLWFTAAANRIKLSTLGFFQYIAPSLMFLLAVFVYDEPLRLHRLITFILIWSALAIFSADGMRGGTTAATGTLQVSGPG